MDGRRRYCIGFFSNQLGLRGTEIALYDYADLNERILGNESVIIALDGGSLEALDKFTKRFSRVIIVQQPTSGGVLAERLDDVVRREKIDSVYAIKGGWIDDRAITACKFCVHAVFRSDTPHGDAFAVVSSGVNKTFGTSAPVLPHVVFPDDNNDDDSEPPPLLGVEFRKSIGIPESAFVFGVMGGRDSFDVPEAFEAVQWAASRMGPEALWFVFLNVDPRGGSPGGSVGKNMVFLPGTSDMKFKRAFMCACDAMLHARRDGETFGLACAEFAALGKPVLTWKHCKDRNHVDMLSPGGLVELYDGFVDLTKKLVEATQHKKEQLPGAGYVAPECMPEFVMTRFRNFVHPRSAAVILVTDLEKGEGGLWGLSWIRDLWHRHVVIYIAGVHEEFASRLPSLCPKIEVRVLQQQGRHDRKTMSVAEMAALFVHEHPESTNKIDEVAFLNASQGPRLIDVLNSVNAGPFGFKHLLSSESGDETDPAFVASWHWLYSFKSIMFHPTSRQNDCKENYPLNNQGLKSLEVSQKV